MFRMVLRFEDGRETAVDGHHDDLREACAVALAIADRSGRPDYDGPEPAKWVRIYDRDRLVIGIEVLAGGLTGLQDA